MMIPRPTYFSGYREPGLLLAFQLQQISMRPVSPPPPKTEPEIPVQNPDAPVPDVKPEIPEQPKIPESEVPPGGPEISPDRGEDLVEIPGMPDMPEVGFPEKPLPGGTLH